MADSYFSSEDWNFWTPGIDNIEKKIKKIGLEVDVDIIKGLEKGAICLRDEVVKNINTVLIKTSKKQRAKSIEKYGEAAKKIKAGRVRKTVDGTGYYVVAGILRGDNKKQFYLKFAEYGTSKQSATPVFRPALIAKEKEVEEIFKESVFRNIADIWGSD